MAKKLFRRFLPDAHAVRTHKSLRRLGRFLHEPNLWHLNRRSVAGGAAVGLFCAFLPIPAQMIPATLVSVLLRVNLPIAIAGVWVTNPLTVAPIYYFCYVLGAWVLGTPVQEVQFAISWEWFGGELQRIWQPFLLGCLLVSSVSAALAYLVVRLLWRLHVVRDWDKRKRRVLGRP